VLLIHTMIILSQSQSQSHNDYMYGSCAANFVAPVLVKPYPE